jgi:hypothetical protein
MISANLGNRIPDASRPAQGQLDTVKGDWLEERSMRQRSRRRPPMSIPLQSQNDPSEICGISHRDPSKCSGISQRDPMGSGGISIAKSFRSWDRPEKWANQRQPLAFSSSRAASAQPITPAFGTHLPIGTLWVFYAYALGYACVSMRMAGYFFEFCRAGQMDRSVFGCVQN